jgi:hypothetical protein
MAFLPVGKEGDMMVIAKKGEMELIAKVKFWFGENEDIFKDNLRVEKMDNFAYIYRLKKAGV